MLLATAAILGSCLHFQADSSAGIYGTAISSYNGHPISGVLVGVPAAGKITVTDAAGRFALSGLPTGKRVIQVSYDGRVTDDFIFILQPLQSKRIAVLLDVDSLDLDPLVVEAMEPNVWMDLAGFYERRATYRGFAHFFTREDVDRVHPAKLSSLLTIDGIVTRCYVDCRPTRFSSRGRLCFVPVNVNGVSLREVDYDKIDIATVAAVEVYRGVPPPDLARSLLPVVGSSTWMGTGRSSGGACGLVEIWTR